VREFGFKFCGIDYSETGCQQALQLLANEWAKGKIVCAEFFSSPETMTGEFDVVISIGVREHFEDIEDRINSKSDQSKCI
jgi:2-polyprenyl-3-methyl-5-hydroxy-6-metoxy-1,4-benzoquinol methylase